MSVAPERHTYDAADAEENAVVMPTSVPFAKHSAESEAERIGTQLNAIRVNPEKRTDAYDGAFRDAAQQLLFTYSATGEEAEEFVAAYRYAEAEEERLDRDRRGDLFEAYEEHPAMLAIDGLGKVLDPTLQKRLPRMRRVMMLLLEAYDA